MPNICAIRTLEVSLAEHHNNLWSNAEKLPHEPKSEHRFMLRLEEKNTTCPTWIGGYAECKHCNCIYADQEDWMPSLNEMLECYECADRVRELCSKCGKCFYCCPHEPFDYGTPREGVTLQ